MLKRLIVICSVCILSACLGGYSPQSKFYNLVPYVQNGVTVSNKKMNIGIDSVELPDYLDKPQIISFDEGNPQMNIDELNRWGEPLDTMIQRMIAADMSEFLPNSVVKIRSSLAEKFNVLINVQIIRFDMIKDDKAILEAWWYVTNTNGVVLYRQKTISSEKIADSYDDYVREMSYLIGKMSEEIAEMVVKY